MTILSIDPGQFKSGVTIIQDGKIAQANIINNKELTTQFREHSGSGSELLVVVEDVKAYSVSMGQSVIDTIKFIGVLCDRLETAGIEFRLLSRYDVKQWIFDKFPSIVIPRIEKKILYLHGRALKQEKRGMMSKDGTMRKPSFVFVDDRIVIACMKAFWGIATPKPGKKASHGLDSHSWQALAVGATYLNDWTRIQERAAAKALEKLDKKRKM